ncbi:hypothetical protein FZC76_00770 [Sutcliffiella horikoshii]|uniref:Uncharacterized protein n=1 Tax=Sutcliffiella horikoshii TaxID=79883 RepID=A0A5D4T4B9_9BACI|nr:hypothetical protein [Sutcliffiella horikoshii]TYS70463.1 hypothetical protein FZC76_00770 [Sutcliffiella horikoshii]
MDQTWSTVQFFIIGTVFLFFFVRGGKELTVYKKGMLFLYIISFSIAVLFIVGNLIVDASDFPNNWWILDTLYLTLVTFLLVVSIQKYRALQKP